MFIVEAQHGMTRRGELGATLLLWRRKGGSGIDLNSGLWGARAIVDVPARYNAAESRICLLCIRSGCGVGRHTRSVPVDVQNDDVRDQSMKGLESFANVIVL